MGVGDTGLRDLPLAEMLREVSSSWILVLQNRRQKQKQSRYH